MGDRPHDPVPIGRVLDDQTKRFGMGEARQVGALFSAWERIVGPSIASHVEPASLRRGILKLRADSPTWATEIGYLREDIRAQANEALGAAVIEKIEVVSGPRARASETSHQGHSTPGSGGSHNPEAPPEKSPPDDPMTAFERARQAWLRRRARRR